MSALKTIDRLAAKKLHEEMNAAILASTHLKAFAEKYGLTLTPSNASFDAGSFTLKVKASLPGVISPMVIQLAALDGFDASRPSRDGKYVVSDYARGAKPWKMVLADGSRPEAYWKAGVAYMKANFHPAPDDAAPTATEAHDLIGREVAPPRGATLS